MILGIQNPSRWYGQLHPMFCSQSESAGCFPIRRCAHRGNRIRIRISIYFVKSGLTRHLCGLSALNHEAVLLICARLQGIWQAPCRPCCAFFEPEQACCTPGGTYPDSYSSTAACVLQSISILTALHLDFRLTISSADSPQGSMDRYVDPPSTSAD